MHLDRASTHAAQPMPPMDLNREAVNVGYHSGVYDAELRSGVAFADRTLRSNPPPFDQASS